MADVAARSDGSEVDRGIGRILIRNPIPAIAMTGLVLGLLVRFGLGRADTARTVWWVALLIGGMPLVLKTLRGMARGRFAADVVALLAILTALVTVEGFAGLIIVLMQSGGEALERYSLGQASSALDQLLARAPQTAWKKTNDHLTQVNAHDVAVGETLVVRPGDLVPVDGDLLSERADVDESALTGEPLTRPKARGDFLMSGSVNTGDAFELRAAKRSDDSQYARIVRLVRQAQLEKAPLQGLADRYAVWFTPLTIIMCGLGWWFTGSPDTILAVLVVATPCPLILAVPVAVISGINRAARAGIIVKGGTAIEQIAGTRAVVFDKTGTLTHGTPMLGRIVAEPGFDEQTVLRLAGSVEQLSSHILGQTLATVAQARCGELPVPSPFAEVSGRGVEGVVEGKRVLVGSRRYLTERLGDVLPPRAASHGEMVTYVAIDDTPAGMILFEDRLRPGVSQLMSDLRGMGVRKTVMLTGDHRLHAEAIAAQAGIDEVFPELLPQGKVEKLRALLPEFAPVVMVGDGINDAPALAAATVGVAMGARGTGISAEAADMVLLVDDVTKVAEAIVIGRRMLRIARQSIYVGLGLSMSLMVIAAFGVIPPAVGALCQEAIDVAVILNALRAR